MTKKEIVDFCKEHLGIEFKNIDGWIVAKSPIRPDERTPSFRLMEDGSFYDFGGDFKAKNITELVSKLKGQSIEEAKEWIASKQEEEKRRPIQINIHVYISDIGASSPVS